MNKIKFFKQNKNAIMPTRADRGSAGWDLCACIVEAIEIGSGCTTLIPTGLNVCLPENWEMQIRPRSGLAAKNSVAVLNSPGTVDESFSKLGRDEIKVILHNHSTIPFVVTHGMRIAQAVFNKLDIVEIEEITDEKDWPEYIHDRKGGFGSTGL